MHLVRWLLAIAWLTLIFSLFYDPISLWLTDPTNLSSPFHIDPEKCIKVQGVCLKQQPYAMGPRIFWGLIVPLGLIILVVFGHEFWRRICPLYFFSQIPRALGIQRKRKVVNPDTGTIRYELADVEKESWLGRNYLYLQFGLFYLGLNIRLLFVNGDAIALGIFLLLTIFSSIGVGFLFKGRSWCQYFCPMASVQLFYTAPRGLLGSDAHLQPLQSITQSMCRTVDSSGKEKSACVSCQSPCIDIDSERSYWEEITRPDQKLVFYGYFGLMFGFFFYYYLYAGNWDYYYSGTWTHEEGLLNSLFYPGFYIFEKPIAIPKIIAAPLILAFFGAVSYFACQTLEQAFRAYLKRKNKFLSNEQILHICFVLCVFVSFNVFFMFGGRPNLALLPNWMELVFNSFIVLVSTLWLYKNLSRSQELYTRESLANSLRRQLNKLAIDWSKFLSGRSLEDLLPDQVYVLAKVLPGFHSSDRLRVYKGVLQESLKDGKAHSANSLEVLKGLRKELNINDNEHYLIITELRIEDPSLLDPQKQRTRENQLRIESYGRGLELLILELVESGVSLQDAFERKQKQIIALRQEYAITTDEQEQVLAHIFNQDGTLLHTAKILLVQLQELAVCYQALENLVINPQASIYRLLRSSVEEKQKLVTKQLISIIEILGDSPQARSIASSTGILAANLISEILNANDEQSQWEERLTPNTLNLLRQPKDTEETQLYLKKTQLGYLDINNHDTTLPTLNFPTATNFDSAPTRIGADFELTQVGGSGNSTPIAQFHLHPEAIVDILQGLVQEIDPLIQSASLYALHQLNPSLGVQLAHQLKNSEANQNWLVQETSEGILGKKQQIVTNVPTVILDIRNMAQKERKIFQQPIIRVGRSHDNDIVILDKSISRQHTIFYLNEQGVIVKDLGSVNGLYIGSKHIVNQQQQLQQGDIVRFNTGNELKIVVQWEMQPVLKQTITETFSTLEKLLWLYESSFFQGVKANALIDLARNSQVRVYRSGETIYNIGEPAQELLVLIDGQAEVRVDVAGREQVIETVLPGQTIGEISVLNNTSHEATAVATALTTRTLAIESKNFEAALADNPLLAKNLLLIMSNRLQENLHSF
ncbi:CRP-like cAMP-activated global transcriptional regulator [Nodularia sphaerocarpa UHCC 0038]|nr:CRP-like cAMP-activated global transcriptional regulator [Nodularia sphaerocarpa UHCC 0038]